VALSKLLLFKGFEEPTELRWKSEPEDAYGDDEVLAGLLPYLLPRFDRACRALP